MPTKSECLAVEVMSLALIGASIIRIPVAAPVSIILYRPVVFRRRALIGP